MNLYIDGVKVRGWNLSADPFPFEVVLSNEPAKNMDAYHQHPFMEITYINAGNGTYIVEDESFPVVAGDVIWIAGNERHRVAYPPDKQLHETVFHFDSALVWPENQDSMPGRTMIAFCSRSNECEQGAIQSMIQSIAEEYRQLSPHYQMMIRSRLTELIVFLLRHYQTAIGWESTYRRGPKNMRLESILQYIAENYDKEINLTNTAKHFYTNTSYFSEYFKKYVGVNFTHYVAGLRVKQAIRLMMQNQDLSAIDVAFSCGFNNTSSFYNAFKKITGVNPGEYMRLHRDRVCV